MKTLIISDYDFKMLQEGKHICTNSTGRFIKLKCVNECTKQELYAYVTQVGGISNYSASISKAN